MRRSSLSDCTSLARFLHEMWEPAKLPSGNGIDCASARISGLRNSAVGAGIVNLQGSGYFCASQGFSLMFKVYCRVSFLVEQ